MDYVRSDRGGGLGANVSLFVPLGRGTISSSYYTRDNAARLEYNRLAALGVGSVGLASGVERRDGADRQFARGSYLGNRFEGFVDVVRSASEGARDTRAAWGFGSAIVMADGAVGISRPVYNSFAIVRGPGEGGYLVEPRTGLGATDTRYTAHTDWLGAAVIPDLQPYLERPIQVDAKDERATPGAGTIFNLKPGFRSGFLVKPAAEQGGGGESVVGVIVDSNGAPIPFASGEARRVRSPDPEPKLVFTNGSGRFILDGVEAGEKYELSITADGQTSRTVLEVPREARGLTRLDTPIKLNLLREKDDAL
jgi:outer membrane usher protein